MEYSNPGEQVATTLAPDLIEEAFGVEPADNADHADNAAGAMAVPPPRAHREYVEGPIVLGYN
ncbi:hypothetical protein [Amycolatopsis albispora]|uniref:Uncharacterized protein n=1 Tax=Amycolatopsis albispora TaxID=1804986 RepID=A0A344LH97_9PSEU|nr:hypothetical protein [Amycolatopsis albispora]AXB47421.1 hypothetical protein A4R43_37335 [Amycolatopsis albispora]